MDFKRLDEIVKSKGCVLVWNEEEFKAKYKDTRSKIEILSKCGHNTIVQASDLINKNTGILCKKCMYEKQSNDKKGKKNDQNIVEYQTIKALEVYCNSTLKFKVLNECTLADVAIQPIDEESDLWLPIQIKTTKSASHGIYGFHMGNKYKNMYVLLFCINEQRIWLLDGNDIHIKKINIGQYNSVYNKYEIELSKISETLIEKYYNSNYFLKTLKDLNIPISSAVKTEQEFKYHREELFTQLKFTYPEINNRVYDCVINDVYKVQDKTISSYLRNDRKNLMKLYVAKLCRHTKDGGKMYKIGDNDFYWLHLPNKKGAYIIPETTLFKNNMISNNDENKEFLSITLFPYHSEDKLKRIKNGWLNEYLYFYDKDIDKINELFISNNKNHVIVKDYIPLVLNDITRNIKIEDKKVRNIFKIPKKNQEENISKIVNVIVSNIFKNVLKNNTLKKIIIKPNNNIIKTDFHMFEDIKIYECIDCKKQLNESRNTRCLECSRLKSRKVERPSYEKLKMDLKETNYSATGRKYGVSDNCIRKWIKYYET